MSKPLLIEIGLEEMPARFIPGAQTQLHQTMTAWLEENRLQYERIHVYSTPRRLAIRGDGLAGKQRDTKTEARGPSKQIAQDEHGQWTKAALGFARGQGVDPDELFFRELKGVKYVYAIKSNIGRATDQLLQESLVELIQGMNFPKNMRWSHYDLRFVRPIRWLVVLFGEDVVPVTIENISAGRKTYGHRFLGTEIELASAKDYVDALRGEFVLVDVEERKDRIVAQIRALAAEKKWDTPKSPQLLNEVLHLVEYPTALFGSLDPQF